MIATKDLALNATRRPGPPGPRIRHGRQIVVRFSPSEWGEIQHLEERTGCTRTEILRRAVHLLATGYPTMPDDCHEWLMRMSNYNDHHGHPDVMLIEIVRHLSKKYSTLVALK